MGNFEITNLKPEYQKIVVNNQAKYNPDFNGVLDENEIGVLMTETGVKDAEELMQSVAVKEDLSQRIANGIHVKRVVSDGKLNGKYSGEVVGAGTGGVGVGVEGGTLNGDISRTVEIDFYEGQFLSDVDENVFKECFRDLDLDNKGKLTAEEIDSYKNYVKDRKYLRELNDNLQKCEGKSGVPMTAGLVAGGVGALAGGIATNGILKGIINKLGNYDVFWQSSDVSKMIANRKDYVLLEDRLLVGITPAKYKIFRALENKWTQGFTGLSKGIVALGAVAGAALVGYGIYKLISNRKSVKEAKEQIPQLKAEIENVNNKIGELNNQYRHIYR